MNIRARLTVIFFGLVIVVLSAISISIYFFSANYREQDFYRRLRNRATNTARILSEVEEVNAELLKRMERNNPASLPNQYIAIYDYQNKERYSSEGTALIAIDTALLNHIRLNKEIRFRVGSFEVLGFLFAEKYDRFAVVAAATDVYGNDALRNLRNILLVTFSVSSLLVSLLGWFFAGRALSPISKIVGQVSNITEKNLNLRLDEGNKTDELSQLSQTFNRMLARLQSAFVSQENFIANASHEIKTPVTIMTGEIEVSLLKQRDEAYNIKVLKSVLSGLKGLDKVSTQLLLLAQTSADQPKKNFAPLRIDDAVWETKEELTKAYPEYIVQINLSLQINPESLTIEGDEQLIRVALLNLMDNGCKYSPQHTVSITLTSSDPNWVVLHFENTGEGIAPDQLEKIFEPFYRGKNNTKIKGSGIGLSLVSRIVSLHHGFLSVASTPGQSTEFIISFPIKTQSV